MVVVLLLLDVDVLEPYLYNTEFSSIDGKVEQMEEIEWYKSKLIFLTNSEKRERKKGKKGNE